MSTGGRRRSGWAAALAIGLSLAPLSVASMGPAAQAAERPECVTLPAGTPAPLQQNAPKVQLTGLSSGVLNGAGNWTITADVTAGPDGLPVGTPVELRVSRSLLSSRYAVAQWNSGSSTGVGNRVLRLGLKTAIPAGATQKVTLTTAQTTLGLTGSGFGPHGFMVVVRDSDGLTGSARSHLVWASTQPTLSAVQFSLVIPVTAGPPAPSTGLPSVPAMAGFTAPGGRLSQLLAMARRPGVVLAVDPALLVAQDAESGFPAIAAWRKELLALVGTVPMIALPSGHPDIPALTHANTGELFTLAQQLGTTQAGALTGASTTTAVLPSGNTDQATAAMLANAGYRTLVLRGCSQPALEDRGVTSTGVSSVNTDVGGTSTAVTTLLADDTLSDTVATTMFSPVQASQRALADLAAIARENPSQPRALLAVAPLDWNPAASGGASLVANLLGQPWVTGATLGQLAAQPSGRVPRAGLATENVLSDNELQRDTLSRVAQWQADGANLAAAVEQPEVVTEGLNRILVGLTSASWRGQSTWPTAADQAGGGKLSQLTGSVAVVPGSEVTQVSQEVQLPVTVRNDLPTGVRVRLHAAPQSNLLQVTTADLVLDLPAKTRAVAHIPVRGVANGDTSVRIFATTPGGMQLGPAVSIQVRVRADWENRAMLAAAGGVAVLLLVGITRTVRRGRTRAEAMIEDQQPPPDERTTTQSETTP